MQHGVLCGCVVILCALPCVDRLTCVCLVLAGNTDDGAAAVVP